MSCGDELVNAITKMIDPRKVKLATAPEKGKNDTGTNSVNDNRLCQGSTIKADTNRLP